jgi:hypothetical protein
MIWNVNQDGPEDQQKKNTLSLEKIRGGFHTIVSPTNLVLEPRKRAEN